MRDPVAGPRRHAVATLRHRDFALLWSGQFISAAGDQIQVVAIAWHIYVLTGSALQLGLVGVARGLPFLVLSMIGGAVADTVDRKRILLFTQAVQIAVSAWLVAATLTGTVSEITLYAVTLLTGAAQAFDVPARQALVPNVVPEEELANAYTLNTLLRQSTLIVGPGIGGVLIGSVGLGWSYAANGISFLALMAALTAMGPVPMKPSASRGSWDLVVGGFRYAMRQPLVRWPLIIDFLTRGVGNARALLPVFAKDVYLVGPEGLGWLNAALSFGAVAGGLVLGARGRVERPVRVLTVFYAGEALCLVALGLSPNFWVALAALFAGGVCNVMAEVPRTTLVQLSTPDELRGRVSALSYTFTYCGPQLGQLDAGALASAFGAPGAALMSGSLAALAVMIFSVPLLRQRQPARQPAMA